MKNNNSITPILKFHVKNEVTQEEEIFYRPTEISWDGPEQVTGVQVSINGDPYVRVTDTLSLLQNLFTTPIPLGIRPNSGYAITTNTAEEFLPLEVHEIEGMDENKTITRDQYHDLLAMHSEAAYLQKRLKNLETRMAEMVEDGFSDYSADVVYDGFLVDDMLWALEIEVK
jgi:hypothetical protein